MTKTNALPRSRQILVSAVLIVVMCGMSAAGTISSALGVGAALTHEGAGASHLTIQLHELNGSGVTGKATLRANGGLTKIGIRLNGDASAYPTHLHEGTCDEFEAMPGAPLADTTPGTTSRTVVELPLDDLLTGSWVIIVHHPEEHIGGLLDPASVIACGEISGSPVASGDSPDDVLSVTTQPPSTGVGSTIVRHSSNSLTLSLAFCAVVICGIARALRRKEQRDWVPYPI